MRRFFVIIIIIVAVVGSVALTGIVMHYTGGSKSAIINGILSGAVVPTYRIGSTNNTIAMAYLSLTMTSPMSASIDNLALYLNETPMNAYKGSYIMHYPEGNGIAESVSLNYFWASSSASTGDMFVALFPLPSPSGSISTGTQLDVVYANVSFSGNTVFLNPAPFGLMGWVGVGIGISSAGHSGELTGVIGDTNYIDGMSISANWWTTFSNNTSVLHFTTANKTVNTGHINLPFVFSVVSLTDYSVMSSYKVTTFSSPALVVSNFPSSADVLGQHLNFSTVNDTSFGGGDSFNYSLSFSGAPNQNIIGSQWAFEISFEGNIVFIATFVPP